MADVEASGKTVEDAIANALEELGASRDQVRVEVISEGRGGVLGIGGGEARVRVRRLEPGEDGEPAGMTPAAELAPGDEDDVRIPGDDDEYEDDGEEDGAEEEDADAEGDEDEGDYIEDEAEIAAQTLDHMLELMGVRADVSIRDAETPGDGLGMVKAVLDIEGDDLGILIGRRGETLTSLQYLLNLMMARQFGEKITFTVDVEGYRRRRERQLNSLARRSADQVKRTHRPVTLEPMPPNERRLIHLALAEDRYVTTESTGEGEDRRVEISLRQPR
jgi:spoIIIJ-associated protein